jgi:hypothetical protein
VFPAFREHYIISAHSGFKDERFWKHFINFPKNTIQIYGIESKRRLFLSEDEANSPLMTARSAMTFPEAALVIGITERTSLDDIHTRFHALVKEWHSDVSRHDPDLSHVMFIRKKRPMTCWLIMA